MADSTNGSVSGSNGSGSGSGITAAAITIGIAVVVAGLTAVGLTGDALLRAVRNQPVRIAVCLSVALVGGALVVLGQLLPSKQPIKGVDQNRLSRQLTIFGLVLIVVPTIAAINLGAQAVSDREFPLVTLQATPIAPASTSASAASQEDSIEIKIIARAVGMTTQNDLLVQVIGLYADPAESPTGATPTPSVTPSPVPGLAIHSAQVGMCESNHVAGPEFTEILDPSRARLLMWDRIGPKADGTIDATWKIRVPAGRYAYVCAWAPVGGPGHRYGSSASYLRLK